MLPSLPHSRFARTPAFGSAADTVADPIADAAEQQNVERQHTTAQQSHFLREGGVVLGGRHAPAAQSALDGSRERGVDQRGHNKASGRARQARIRYRDHGVSSSSRREPRVLQHSRDDRHHGQRDRQKYFPAQPHELVVAIARNHRLHHGEQKEDEQRFEKEPDHPRHPGEGRERRRRQPPAEKQDRRHSAHGRDRDVFAEKEQQERRRGIFDRKTRDQLGFSFHQIEWGAVGLG